MGELRGRAARLGRGAVDHLSFVLMADAGITEAFTNDAHFRTAGFVTLF